MAENEKVLFHKTKNALLVAKSINVRFDKIDITGETICGYFRLGGWAWGQI